MQIIDSLIKKLYIFLFFFTPLIIFGKTTELFEFNKMLFIYFVSASLLLLYLLKLVLVTEDQTKVKRRNKRKKGKEVLMITLLLFLFIFVLSTINSINIHTSLFGYYGRFNGGLFSLLAYYVIFFVGIHTLTRRDIKDILVYSLFSSVIVILWGLLSKIGHDPSCFLFTGEFNDKCWTSNFIPHERIFSTLGQPNWLGAYLGINFFIALYFVLKYWKESKTRVLIFIYLFLNLLSLSFTRSRSSMLAVLAAEALGILIVILSSLKNKKRIVRLFMSVCFFTLVIFALFGGFEAKLRSISILDHRAKTQERTTSKKIVKGKNKEKDNKFSQKVTDSFTIRKIVWRGAVKLVLRYPLLGTGPETFAYSYYFVRPVEHNLTSEWDYLYNKAHNEFLNYAATTGVISLALYCFLILTTFYLLWKKFKEEESLLSLFLLLSFLVIQITNFFGFSTTTINLFFFFIPTILYIEDREKKLKKRKIGFFDPLIILAGAIVYLYVLLFLFNYFTADKYFALSKNYATELRYDKAVYYVEKALSLHSEDVYRDKLAYYLANLSFIFQYEGKKEDATKLRKASLYYNTLTLNNFPLNVLFWKTRAKVNYIFYEETKDVSFLKNALQAMDKAEKLYPTDPKNFYTKAIFYLDLYKAKKEKRWFNLAFKNVKKSLRLKPNYEEAFLFQKKLINLKK